MRGWERCSGGEGVEHGQERADRLSSRASEIHAAGAARE